PARDDMGGREHAEPTRDLQEKRPYAFRRSVGQVECHEAPGEESKSAESRSEPRRRALEIFFDTGVAVECRLADSCLVTAEPAHRHGLASSGRPLAQHRAALYAPRVLASRPTTTSS